jgi:hypothetical protein
MQQCFVPDWWQTKYPRLIIGFALISSSRKVEQFSLAEVFAISAQYQRKGVRRKGHLPLSQHSPGILQNPHTLWQWNPSRLCQRKCSRATKTAIIYSYQRSKLYTETSFCGLSWGSAAILPMAPTIQILTMRDLPVLLYECASSEGLLNRYSRVSSHQ